jgi:hypothetical protein
MSNDADGLLPDPRALAHPAAANLAWQFTADAEADPASRVAGWEVWTGPWQPDDEASLAAWDRMLGQGWRVNANGGSDLHGVVNDGDTAIGLPTTVVYADRLAARDIVAALKAGRSFITRAPDGVEIYLSAARAGQAAGVGGAVHGAPGDPVTVTARVRRGGGMRLVLVSDGAPVLTRPLTSDDETVQTVVPIPPAGGYVRAEVRGAPRPNPVNPVNPKASQGDMEALTNPVRLVVGDLPPGYAAETPPDLRVRRRDTVVGSSSSRDLDLRFLVRTSGPW